jgi:hypothetical protein
VAIPNPMPLVDPVTSAVLPLNMMNPKKMNGSRRKLFGDETEPSATS